MGGPAVSDSKVKVKARKEVEPRKRGSLEIEPTGEVVRRPSPQPLAIALTDYLKMPEEEQDPISEVELDLIEAIECLDEQEQEIEPVGFDAPGEDFEGDESDDFTQLDPDTNEELAEALRDEDAFEAEEPPDTVEPDLWPDSHYATDPFGNPTDTPLPAIEINEFGDVTVTREAYLIRCADREFSSVFDPRGDLGKGMKRVEILRAFGEAIVKHNLQELLTGPPLLEEAKLAPLTQKSVFEGLTVPANSSVLVSATFVKTPLWGIVPLSAFFSVDKWEVTIEEVKRFLDAENVREPDSMSSKSYRWRELVESSRHLETLRDNRMLRNKMKEFGIPLAKGRKEIWWAVSKWVRDHKPERVKRAEIPAMVADLVSDYEMFSTHHTRIYQAERFQPFVEERAVKILETLRIAVD